MRPRLISLNALRNGLLNPRLGSRRCSGICPPSKPLTATPVRAFWPLTPRPAVLPLPEPMPRPTRRRDLRAPGRSAISESFIALSSLASLADHADEVAHLGDHAACRRRVGQVLDPADLVEAEPDQGLALDAVAARRTGGLLNPDGLLVGHAGLLLVGGRLALAVAAAGLQGGDLDVAARRHRARRILVLQRIEGRPHHVVRIGRADRLRHHVLHAERLEHGAHGPAGDDAGAGGRRAQKYFSGAVAAEHVVVQGAAPASRSEEHTSE